MASCANCTNGNIANGVNTNYNSFPNSQLGFYYSYPTSCPGGCIYLTSGGFRCSNSTSGTCTGCNQNGCSSGSCNGGCGCSR